MGYWQEIIIILFNLAFIIDCHYESISNGYYKAVADKKIKIVLAILNILIIIKHIL